MDTSDTYIQQLLEQFDFNELPNVDSAFVLEQMSEEAYSDLRQTVLKSLVYFENEPSITPKPVTKSRLDNRFNERERIPSVWLLLQQAFTYRIPAYQMALGVVLLFLGFNALPKKDSNSEESAKIEYIYQTKYDTIEQIVFKEQPVERIVYVKAPMTKSTEKTKSQHSMSSVEMPFDNQRPLELKDVQKSLGNSKINASDLDQFRVSM